MPWQLNWNISLLASTNIRWVPKEGQVHPVNSPKIEAKTLVRLRTQLECSRLFQSFRSRCTKVPSLHFLILSYSPFMMSFVTPLISHTFLPRLLRFLFVPVNFAFRSRLPLSYYYRNTFNGAFSPNFSLFRSYVPSHRLSFCPKTTASDRKVVSRKDLQVCKMYMVAPRTYFYSQAHFISHRFSNSHGKIIS